MAKDLEEGHGAIAHYYHYGLNSNGVNSSKGGSMSSWAEKQMNDLVHIRNAYHGGGKSPIKFRVNETVLTRQAITLTDREIPRGTRGKVFEVAKDGSYTLDFGGKLGKIPFSAAVAEARFEVVRGDTIRESIIKGLTDQYKVPANLLPGQRVKDAAGHQYFVEQGDVFGRRFQVMNTEGNPKIIERTELQPMSEEEPFGGPPSGESIANGPLPPGAKVIVRNIDPVNHTFRRYGVAPGEAAGIIGQTGVLEFAFYAVPGSGPIYRVLLSQGGRKDFSSSEIQVVDN